MPVHRVHVSVHSEVTSWPADWSVPAVLASHWSAVVCDRCRSNSWHLSWSPVRSWPSSSSLHQSYNQISMKLELGNTDHHLDKQWLVKFYHWRQGEEDRMRGGERKWVLSRYRENCESKLQHNSGSQTVIASLFPGESQYVHCSHVTAAVIMWSRLGWETLLMAESGENDNLMRSSIPVS